MNHRSIGSGRRSRRRQRAATGVAAACTAALLVGCTGAAAPPADPSTSGSSVASTPTSSASASSAPEPTADISGVEVTSRVEGFERPWDLRFLPDGTALVTERAGRLAAVVDGRRQVVDEVPGVVAQGEGGLMGLALDPAFESNRRIYLCYAAGSGGVVDDVRVVRFQLAENLDGLHDPTPIVTGLPAGAGNRHLGCRVDVGPDGMLWITAGDAVTPTAPQDPTSRAGKVLRATLAGEPAPDNPGGRWDPYVFTLGHRNVQGLSFRPGDDTPFTVEHGTGCDDEINLLVAGANYGWNPVGSEGGYAENAPMTSSDIDGARAAVWSSGCPTIAPSGAEFVTGPQWGRWAGALAVAVLKDQELLLVELDGDTVADTRTELAGDLGRLRTVRNGADGSLWLTVDADRGEVVQIVPRP